MPTQIILVRHGQSTFNAAKRFQGASDDSVLTQIGRLTAYQTGLALNHIGFDAVYVSPLKRTQETAHETLAAIAAVSGTVPPLHPHPNLKEVHLPQWEGLSYQEVQSRFAEAYQQWQHAPHEFRMELPQSSAWSDDRQSAIATLARPTTFSPLHQLYTQAKQFWQEILPKHRNQTLLIISHGGTIRALISTAIGLEMNHYHRLQQSNSGISRLTFTQPDRPAQLEALNLTTHLGEALPKLKNGKQGIRLVLFPVGKSNGNLTTLASRLISVPMNVCITDASDRAQTIAKTLLSQHPKPAIQLQVNQPDFLLNWHQAIHSKMQSQTGLNTALVVASMDQINSLLNHILHLPQQRQTLVLRSETPSVLYYPASTSHPVLQAMNLGTGEFAED